MYNLHKEVNKIIGFAKTLNLKEKEFFGHNLFMISLLGSLFLLHILLSFLVIHTSLLTTIIIILLNGHIIYFYLTVTVHEGTHNLIFFSKVKKISNLLARSMYLLPILVGYPAFNIYKKDHFNHHIYVSEKEDPQNSSHLNFRKVLLFYSTARSSFSFKKIFEGTNLLIFILFLLLKLLHLYLLYYFGGLLGLFIGFIIPFFIAALFNGIRISFRHYNLYPNPKPLRSRSYTFLGSSIVAPLGLRFHFEHHLYPGIPSYRLYKVYNFVEKNCPKELVKKVHYKRFIWKDFW